MLAHEFIAVKVTFNHIFISSSFHTVNRRIDSSVVTGKVQVETLVNEVKMPLKKNSNRITTVFMSNLWTEVVVEWLSTLIALAKDPC